VFRRIPIAQEGVVVSNPVGKGKGLTNAKFATTTEVYPDSKSKPVTGVRVPPPPLQPTLLVHTRNGPVLPRQTQDRRNVDWQT
jgi:hypothetical protein